MVLPPKEVDDHLVYLDPFLLDRLCINKGLSRKGLAMHKDLHLAMNTVLGAFEGKGLYPASAKSLIDFLAPGAKVVHLLAPWDRLYEPPADPSGPWSGAPEWEWMGYLDQGRLAANGLYFIVCRMKHRHTANKSGRGKFYQLGWMPVAKREGMRHQLSRHADVCAKVGVHPHIAVNHTSTPATNDEGWWVIDEWVGERTLAERLYADGSWPRDKLPRLLFEIAQGLQSLHENNIVFRELAPSRVLISDKDGHAVLTDFELAKLLDGIPSVSGDWPEDPYRAPEIKGTEATVQADLYSLALAAAAAMKGGDPDPGEVVSLLGAAGMPRRLHGLMVDCSAPARDRRPPDLSGILKELARWAKE
jgi:serine/threonine protein kinase